MIKWTNNKLKRLGVGCDGTIFRIDEDGSLHIFWSDRSGVIARRRKNEDEPVYREQHCPLGGTVKNAITIAQHIDNTYRKYNV
jgi:hypothetical protein